MTLQTLEHLPRIGWCQRGVPNPESVAAHSHAVAQVALALIGDSDLDKARVLAMAIVHDAPEALLGDLPRSAVRLLPDGAKPEAEARAARLLLDGFSLDAFREFQAQATRESRFVRLCDKLQLGLRLLAYRRAGQSDLEEFEAGIRELDASEFEPTESLRVEIVRALELLA